MTTLGDVAIWMVFLAGAMTGAVVLVLVIFVLGALSLSRDQP